MKPCSVYFFMSGILHSIMFARFIHAFVCNDHLFCLTFSKEIHRKKNHNPFILSTDDVHWDCYLFGLLRLALLWILLYMSIENILYFRSERDHRIDMLSALVDTTKSVPEWLCQFTLSSAVWRYSFSHNLANSWFCHCISFPGLL